MTSEIKTREKYAPAPQTAQNLDLFILIKAAEWGEEEDHIQYINEIKKK